MKKHKPPVACQARLFFITPSPSAIFCKCALGLHRRTRRCPGCEANTEEVICESLRSGIEAGLEAGRRGFIVTEEE